VKGDERCADTRTLAWCKSDELRGFSRLTALGARDAKKGATMKIRFRGRNSAITSTMNRDRSNMDG
jgi:hypothetical protein